MSSLEEVYSNQKIILCSFGQGEGAGFHCRIIFTIDNQVRKDVRVIIRGMCDPMTMWGRSNCAYVLPILYLSILTY